MALSLLAIASPQTTPRLLWNASPSVPVGLYRVAARSPARGRLAVIRLPGPLRALAEARAYLAASALLLKPVAAGPGDVVCRHGATVTINGRVAARARRADAAGRPLPRWSGCVTLAAHQVFVLAPTPDSFDSRYFGALDRGHVLGTAHAIWPRPIDGHTVVPPRQRGPPRHAAVAIAA
jgi:conjugative transfer signal peptidase TraF